MMIGLGSLVTFESGEVLPRFGVCRLGPESNGFKVFA
jgi:hypothetical protein